MLPNLAETDLSGIKLPPIVVTIDTQSLINIGIMVAVVVAVALALNFAFRK